MGTGTGPHCSGQLGKPCGEVTPWHSVVTMLHVVGTLVYGADMLRHGAGLGCLSCGSGQWCWLHCSSEHLHMFAHVEMGTVATKGVAEKKHLSVAKPATLAVVKDAWVRESKK